MKQDIRIGQKDFIVDDPHGSLARPAPDEQQGVHEESASLANRIRGAGTPPPEPLPNNVDPMGSIRGRAILVERIYQGRMGAWGAFFAWVLLGSPCLFVVYMMFDVVADAPARIHSLTDVLVLTIALLIGLAPSGFGLWVVLHGTYMFLTRETR